MLLQGKVAWRGGKERKLQSPKHKPLYFQICNSDGDGMWFQVWWRAVIHRKQTIRA